MKIDQKHDLERITDASPDAMVLVDAAGQIVLVNSQAERMFGYTRAEMLNETVELLIPKRYRAAHTGHRSDFSAQPRQRGMGANLDLYGLTKDGDEFSIDVNLSPVELHGAQYALAAVRDFSIRHQAEVELRSARDDARRANAIKTRFLAAASHDLRQPLQSLGLYLSVLSKQVEGEPATEVVQKMRKSLDVMGDMLDVLLDLSKLESGTVVPEYQQFSLSGLLGEIREFYSALAADKGIALELSAPATSCYSDPVLLRRIIDNLVSNAIRYTDTGSVRIECTTVESIATVSVHDSGSGIPPEKREIIFDEYYQLENPSRDRRSGLGLGLAIVKHVARLLDHPVELKSEVGVGSVFSVSLPIAGDANRETPGKQTTDLPTGLLQSASRVLLVDDDPSIIDAMTLLFEAEGLEVYAATDSEEALAHLRDQHVPDFIVSDYRLPGPTGVELIRLIRNELQTAVPAVLMTGDTTAKLVDETDLPDCAVLHKPVDTDYLLGLISTAANDPH